MNQNNPYPDVFNLLLCSVKKATEASRPFGMELHSADSKNITLHANDEKDLQHWMELIQDVIAALLNGEMRHGVSGGTGRGSPFLSASASSSQSTINPFEELQSIKGNEICADCGQSGSFARVHPRLLCRSEGSLTHHPSLLLLQTQNGL
jgi:hypothetical protein